MKDTCGCCEGTEPITPEPIANRPGLDALRYRVGTHATFLETMLARLSSRDYPALAAPSTELGSGLGARNADDPAIALLDAWATVADVLTFYQERIANEGYLRTATERRSILELARLVGYSLRPGVSSSVYLAYTLDDKTKEPVVIPKGAGVQSVPGPGETAQTFETSEALEARQEWSALKPRLSQPQRITLDNVLGIAHVYLEGVATNLNPGDRFLFVFGDGLAQQAMRKVQAAEPDFAAQRTDVTLVEVPLLARILVPVLKAGLMAAQEAGRIGAMPRMLRLLGNLYLGNYQALPVPAWVMAHDPPADLLYAARLPWDLLLGLQARPAFLFSFAAPAAAMETGGLVETELPGPEVRRAMAIAAIEAATAQLQEPTTQWNLACLATSLVNWVGTQVPPCVQKSVQGALLEAVPQWLESWQALQKSDDAELVQAAQGLLGAVKMLLATAELRDALERLWGDWTSDLDPADSSELVEAWELLTDVPKGPSAGCGPAVPETTTVSQLVIPLLKRPSLQPASALRLARSSGTVLGPRADTIPQALVSLQPALRTTFYRAWARANVRALPAVERKRRAEAGVVPPALLQAVYALRLSAPLFGHNAPVKMALKTNPGPDPDPGKVPFIAQPDGDWAPSGESATRLFLDSAYEAILPDSYVLVQKQPGAWLAAKATRVETQPRTEYGISGKSTQVDLSRVWWNPNAEGMATLRASLVHAQSEKLTLAEEPVEADVAGKQIVLGGLYDGLASGRWLIVFGERTDVPGTSGVQGGEPVMLSAVEQVLDPTLPGDKAHSLITLANALAYTYKRDTVTIYGNVVKATHGETRAEVLGSGDASQALQSFTLKQPPLTYVAAPNSSGAESTLVVRVNDVQWREATGLAGLGPAARCFIMQTDDEAKTTVIFGNGRQGARLPTGTANVKATYRNGIGKAGNVRAGQISLLVTRPLGVKEVVNPLSASGGADKESRDQARKNAPLAVMALDRLVSVQDYADFARTFAGIGKTSAVRLSDGRRELVHVTVAGADDIPIDKTSDLYLNLVQALRQNGDPYQPVQVDPRELLLLIAEASVRLLPDCAWELQEPKIRAALLDAFSFERRELGQDVLYAEVIACIQAVPGVAYVDLDTLDAASEQDVLAFLAQDQNKDLIAFLKSQRESRGEPGEVQPRKRVVVHLAHSDGRDGRAIAPAQLAFLSPEVPDTLILKEITL